MEHILSQAHSQDNAYIFIIACLNYLTLPLVNLDSKVSLQSPLPLKVREVLKAMKISV